jgi:predicted PurR-regulated permease PerM
LKAALVALGVFVLIVANQVILTIGLSLVFALGLDPVVAWFTRRGMGRG